jgi:hypothetical protein
MARSMSGTCELRKESAKTRADSSALLDHLARNLTDLARYDQFIADAEGCPELEAMYRRMKRDCQAHIRRLRGLIRET